MNAIRVTCKTADSLPLEQIVEFQGDLKTLNEPEFKKLKASILKYGLSFPSFIWRDNGSFKILDGHQRSRVLGEMKKEGYLIPPVPVVYVDAKDAKEAKEKVLLMSSQYGKYTMDSVYEFIQSAEINFDDMKDVLALPQFDLDKFERGYFTDPIEEGPEPRFDEAEQLRKKYGVELGQIWQLGEHRLTCGDSTAMTETDVSARFEFSDPPYELETEGGGILKDAAQMKAIRRAGIDNFSPQFLKLVTPTAVFCCNKPLILDYISLAESIGVAWDICFYAKKNTPPNYGGHLMTDVEYLMVLGQQSPKRGQEKELYSKAFFSARDEDGSVAWAKPVELVRKFIRLFSDSGETVVDRFLGSGTTLIACEQLGRKCYAMEISPEYVAVAIQRWVDLTSKTPKLMPVPATHHDSLHAQTTLSRADKLSQSRRRVM